MAFLKVFPLLRILYKNRKKTIFGYEADIVYDDSTANTKILSYEDDKIKLIGKPDFVLKLKNGDFIIIDAKSGKLDDFHEFGIKMQSYKHQIACYFLIVKDSLNIEAKYGELHFLEDKKKYVIENTVETRKLTLDTLYFIAEAKKSGLTVKQKSYIACSFCFYENKCLRKTEVFDYGKG